MSLAQILKGVDEGDFKGREQELNDWLDYYEKKPSKPAAKKSRPPIKPLTRDELVGWVAIVLILIMLDFLI